MIDLNTTKIRKALLAGTAIVAVGAFGMSGAHAADQTLTGAGTWASAGTAVGTDVGDASDASTGDAVDVDTNTLTITDDGTTDDGGGAGVYNIGAITDTDTGAAGTGGVLITSTAGQGTVTATIASAAVAGDFVVTNTNADNLDVTATVTGALTVGGNLNLINLEATTAADLSLTVGGATTITGTTQITGGDVAGTSSTINFDGNTAFTGTVTVLGGGHAGGTADATFSGATNTFTGGLVITDAVGAATATFDGAVAQTVSGAVSGTGSLVIDNASGVTFAGAVTVADITIEGTAADSSATFQNTVTSAILLGTDGAADTNTLVLDGQTQAFTVTGAISGTAGETNNISVIGSDVITLTGAASGAGGELDNLSITGSSTLTTDQNLTVTATSVGTGSTLATTGGTLTTNITSTGTVLLNGGDLTGTLDGAGTLDVDASATVTGNIGTTTALTAIDIAAAQTLTVTGDVTATTITMSGVGTGTLALNAGAHTITGNIVTATNGAGAITVADNASTSAIVGNVGTAAATLATLDVAGGAANVLTTTGHLYVDAITLDNADTLSFIGTSAQAVSGTIAGGILNVGDGTLATSVTFAGAITGAVTQNVQLAATARYNANATFTGAYTNTGSTEIGIGATLDVNTLVGAGGFVLDINDADGTLTTADVGVLDFSGSVVLSRSRVAFNVTGFLDTTATVDILADAGDAFATAGELSDNSALYTFTTDTDGIITVGTVSTASITNTTSNANTADELLSIGAAATGELEQVQDAFVSASSTTVDGVLEAAASDMSGGAVVAAMGVTNQTSSITNKRLTAFRSGEIATGMSAGNVGSGLNAWGQVFGVTADQDDRKGVSGYDADTYGVAVGLDTVNMHDNMVVGIALTYADTEVDSDGLANNNTEVDTYQVTLYGDYDVDDRTYISGQLAYAYGQVDATRNPGGISTITANADYDTNQISANLETGRSYSVGNGMTLTPSISASYMSYNADSYTETGAGGANLVVDSDTLNVLEFGLGLEASWMSQYSDGSYVKPVIKVGVRHDVIGDEVEATNTFTGGGAAFKTEGFDPAQTTFNGGVALSYYSTTNWDLTAGYDAEFKSDYVSHSGVLKATYKF